VEDADDEAAEAANVDAYEKGMSNEVEFRDPYTALVNEWMAPTWLPSPLVDPRSNPPVDSLMAPLPVLAVPTAVVDVEEPAADRSNEVEAEPNCNEWLRSMRPPSPPRSTSPSPFLTPLESYQRWSAPKATFTPDPSEQWWQKEIREAEEARAALSDTQTMDEE